jgi:hypothetical protein
MDMNDTITSCPLCGGQLQSTQVWYVYKTVSKASVRRQQNGGIWLDVLEDEDAYNGEEHLDSTRLYCENDHLEHQMVAAIHLSSKENK